MASCSSTRRTEINLASRMEEGEVQNVEDLKSSLASHNVDVNARNTLGWSPLMIACANCKKSMVSVLLEHGADPNAQCTKYGNTPMHYATLNNRCLCLHGDTCDYFVYREKGEAENRLDIIKLLISYGATSMCNSSGLNPACMAAIHKLPDIVNFFVQKDTWRSQLSDAEKARACEILGLAIALDPNFEWYKCSHGSADMDPYVYFCRALAMRKESGVTSTRDYEKSDLAASFFLFSTEACKTHTDWEQIKMDTLAVKTQSFLLADKVLPEEIKTNYILRRLLTHAYGGIFCFWRSQERLSQGLLIFRDALQWELQSKLATGTVLSKIFCGIERESLLDEDALRECFELMDRCLQVFSKVSMERLHRVHMKLMNELGSFLCSFGLFNGCRSKEMFELVLQFGEKMISLFRRRCGKEITSVTSYIIEKLDDDVRPCTCFENDRQVIDCRVKRLISRIVQCEDASEINEDGNSMLHSLFQVSCMSSTDDKFIRDIALILIRNGCDVGALNDHGETVQEMISISNPDPIQKELINLVSPPTSVLPLEELAARTILRHKIPHEGVLPGHVSSIIRGELEPDSELFPPHTQCESSSDLYYESDFEIFSSDGGSFDPSDSPSLDL